jgi:hypothetical protein
MRKGGKIQLVTVNCPLLISDKGFAGYSWNVAGHMVINAGSSGRIYCLTLNVK